MAGTANIAWLTVSSVTYATWNPSDKNAGVTLSGGDLTTTRASGTVAGVRATLGKSSGKWYFEIKCISSTGVFDVFVGLANLSASLTALPGFADANGWAIALDGGDYYHSGFVGLVNGGAGFTAAANDVFGFAWDAGANTLSIYRNNTLLTPSPLFSTLTGTLYPILAVQTNTVVLTANFGASALTYTPPAGYNTGLYN
jgi:hypothetical protein